MPQHVETNALFESLFTASPDGIIVADSEERIVEANPRVESLFGYASSELLGNPVEILIPERFRSIHVEHRTLYTRLASMRPMGNGLELCGRRKDGSEFPVDIVLSYVERASGQLFLAIIRDITERKQLEQEMRQLALSDPLTALGNYRRLQEAFETELKWSARTGRSSILLLLDVDGLKRINDNYGHLVGSRALCRLADVLRAECRAIDTPVRYGGDEFVVILPDTDAEGAQNLAVRLAGRLASDREDPPITFSYGIGVCPLDGTTLDQLLAFADCALYAMKKPRLRSAHRNSPSVLPKSR